MEIFLVVLLVVVLILLGQILKQANETIYHIYVILKMIAVVLILYKVEIGEIDIWGMHFESSNLIAYVVGIFTIWMLVNVLRKARLL